MIVQERDRHVLRELAVMRVIDREQAKCVAGFGSTTRANTRLLALTRAGLLRRFFLGTSGSGRKALYALSQRGAELVGVPLRGLRRAAETTIVADFSVTHQLRINESFCAVKYRPIPITGAQFVQWRTFSASVDAVAALIPDGYFEVGLPDGIFAAFVEVDLGHERKAAWRKKVEAYLRYAVSGHFEKQFSQRQFRALVIGSSERSVRSLRATTSEVTQKIFRFTTFDRIAAQGFWSDVWERPTGGERQPLITLA
jgi:hypothetical protein